MCNVNCILKINYDSIIPLKFFCYRGTLTKISSFPYENKEDLILSVIKFKGTIFIWWYRIGETANESIDYRKAIYGGYRFEKMITKSYDINNDGKFHCTRLFNL